MPLWQPKTPSNRNSPRRESPHSYQNESIPLGTQKCGLVSSIAKFRDTFSAILKLLATIF